MLYHHYGNADGLLSAAIAEAFPQFLENKKAAVQSLDPVTALSEGWDDYVRFAAARSWLYAAMMSRVLKGAQIHAAEQAFGLLIERIAAIAAGGAARSRDQGGRRPRMGIRDRIPASRHGPAPQDGATRVCGH
jgi:AcrR family transcriptional regulator